MVKDWDAAYQDQHTPWDLRGITPPLERLVDRDYFQSLGFGPGTKVAVPGCGRGHDLRVFADLGFAVTGFDIAPASVAEANDLLELNRVSGVDVRCRDVLGLLPEFQEQFDLVYDYTCFCALAPHLRGAYAEVVAGLLRPGGFLVMLAFPLGGPLASVDKPPFLVRVPDLHAAFEPQLQPRDSFAAEGSVVERDGDERWFIWQR